MNITPDLSKIPTLGKRIALRVSPAAKRAIRQGHPWLFEEAIQHQSHSGAPGDLAVIFDNKRNFLAIGLYDPTSPIRVRVLHQGQPTSIDQAWFESKLTAAIRLRDPILQNPLATNGYRLVHGENDGLPGLVIDRYASTCVIKLYTSAWIPHLQNVCDALSRIVQYKYLILRLNRLTAQQTKFLYGLEDGIVLSQKQPRMPILFQENGLTFEVDPIQGQKTGFFLDQRDNRAWVEKLSAGKDVLNVFAYTGGFSVYAARGGAQKIVSVDINQPALEAAQRNMAHNEQYPTVKAASHRVIGMDAFRFLVEMQSQGTTYDLVILDPPMFAQNQAQVEGALSAYRKLTQLGLTVLRKGGILVQASCSSRVSEQAFFTLVNNTAQQVGRSLTEIERTTHPLDHPIGFKEGAYLKCLFAYAK